MAKSRHALAPALILSALAGGAAAAPIDIVFDYRDDAAGFFGTPASPDLARRAALDAAAAVFEQRFSDDLAAIVPSGGNSWMISYWSPAAASTPVMLSNLVVPAQTLVVFVGGRNMGPSTLASGGPGTASASGSTEWSQTVATRHQAGAAPTSGPATDFGPWGGSITFNTARSWNTDLSAPQPGLDDLFTTATHELAHVLGVGTAASWTGRLSGGVFTGPYARAANGGVNPPVTTNGWHWAYNLASVAQGVTQETAMDPDNYPGVRKYLTRLDYAALMDIGWSARPGDADLDHDVDLLDLATLGGRMGKVGGWAAGDFDDDGIVTASDLAILTQAMDRPFGTGSAPLGADGATPLPVPEPGAGVGLLTLLALGVPRRQRGR